MIQNSRTLLILTLKFASILFLPHKMFYCKCELEASPGCEMRSPIPPTIELFWHQHLLGPLAGDKAPLKRPLSYFRGLLCCLLVLYGRGLAGPSVVVAALPTRTLVRILDWGRGWPRVLLRVLPGSTPPHSLSRGCGTGGCLPQPTDPGTASETPGASGWPPQGRVSSAPAAGASRHP